jgi:hypothetical protein
VGITAAALLFAACGDDEDPEDGGDATATSTAAATSTATATRTATATATGTATAEAGETIAVTAVDYAFEGLPETVEAGTKLTMTNASDVEARTNS